MNYLFRSIQCFLEPYLDRAAPGAAIEELWGDPREGGTVCTRLPGGARICKIGAPKGSVIVREVLPQLASNASSSDILLVSEAARRPCLPASRAGHGARLLAAVKLAGQCGQAGGRVPAAATLANPQAPMLPPACGPGPPRAAQLWAAPLAGLQRHLRQQPAGAGRVRDRQPQPPAAHAVDLHQPAALGHAQLCHRRVRHGTRAGAGQREQGTAARGQHPARCLAAGLLFDLCCVGPLARGGHVPTAAVL